MQVPLEINNRKYRANTQHMKITYYKEHENQIDFRVGVIGSQKIPYILEFSQSTLNITCTCPDYEKRQYKPICKHMFFIVNLSNQKAIFNNLMLHNELKDVTKLETIRLSLINIIDTKKMGSELSESNVISIERDDYCSICMCDLDGQIEKCSICAHVMHDVCIQSWWNLSSSWNSLKGICPYCKSARGFLHIKPHDEDPWRLFDFSGAASAAPGAASAAPGAASAAPGAASAAPGAASAAPGAASAAPGAFSTALSASSTALSAVSAALGAAFAAIGAASAALGTTSSAPGAASAAPGAASAALGAASAALDAASEAPIADFFPEVELQDQHESLFGPVPDQDPIENLRIQLDQELEIGQEIRSEISILQIENDIQRRLIIQLESLENEQQIIQNLLQPPQV
jgi:hypothetical protein